MHVWEGKAFAEVSLLPQRRDPQRFTIGCATQADGAAVIQWFYNIPELSQWLRRMEPQRWGYQGAELIRIKAALEPALTQVDVYGLQTALRRHHNSLTENTYQVVWWGRFQDLLEGRDDWSQAFLQNEGLGLAADATELAERLRHRILPH